VIGKRGYPPACLATDMSRPPSLARSLTAANNAGHEGIPRIDRWLRAKAKRNGASTKPELDPCHADDLTP
jgi:hypothetical protein